MSHRREIQWLRATIAAITAVLVGYAVTYSLTWDEGFHLVAAQLIRAGKKPYVDFLFAQTPLNAYWNAFWMSVAGQTWRTAHAVAALETAAAVALTADYVFRRLPAPEWRFTAAVATALLVGLNGVVVEFGTVGQAYGLCLLLTVAAFRFAAMAVSRRSPILMLLAGLAAGAAAASSLLTVTVAPVILLWILWRSQARVINGALFCCGVAVPFLPMFVLFLQAPEQIIFDVIRFHLFYRQVLWDNWMTHDLDVLTAWLDCFHALLLGLLALLGLFMLCNRAIGDAEADGVRAEFLLAGWIAIAGGLYLMTAHPTFPRYFMLITPFAGIVAAAGIAAILTRIALPPAAHWPLAVLAILMSIGLVRALVNDRNDNWNRFAPIANKVNAVTPPGAMLYADEHIYFMTGRIPPPGQEWNGAHKVDLPMEKAAPLHILPRAELNRRVQAGIFDTVETCDEEEPAGLGLAAIYRQHADINDCFIYWDRRPDYKPAQK